MKKSVLFLTFLFLFNSNFISAQVTQEWVARYNGPGNGNDYSHCLALDASGNVYVSGENVGIGSGNDIVTIKYNSSGTQIWAQSYNSGSNTRDAAFAITVSQNGNIYVTGTQDNGACITLKYTSGGALQWSRSVYYALGLDIKTDASENIYVAGYIDSSGNNPDFLVLKYDNGGILQWARTYNGPGDNLDIANFIGVDAAGNVYASGDSYSGSNYLTSDYAVVKYDPAGVLQWVRRYNGPGNSLDENYGFAVDASGNSFITGNCRNINNSDFTTIKYNSAGVQQWVAFYNGIGNYYDGARAICLDAQGNVYVTGFTSVTAQDFNFDYGTVKYNSSGVQQWAQLFNGSGNGEDDATALAVDSSGNVYVSGISWNGARYEFATVKYNPSGIQQWVQSLNGTANAAPHVAAIGVDAISNIYVTGYLAYTGAGQDYTTVKYNQLVSNRNNNENLPTRYELLQNFPNPFNPATRIKFDIPSVRAIHELPVQLKIYDILGREVATLVNEELKPGTYEVEWDGANFPSGVYYYQLKEADYSETRKMVLIK